MAATGVELEVRLFDRLSGTLRDSTDRGLSFQYSEAWVADRLPPLSQSLPVRAEPYGDQLTRAFFGNLLPEGGVRDIVCKRLKVAPDDDYGLLAKIGRDCAGAVTIVTVDGPNRQPGVEWLTEAELTRRIEELPSNPLLVDIDQDIRLSLAGAQDKMVVVVAGERIGLPVGGAPSTHILKPALEGFESTPTNEAFCLALARKLGLEVPEAMVRTYGEREVLIIERFDRTVHDGTTVREHQEDFCQALGLPARRKYEESGGPGIADCIGLLRKAADNPAREALRFIDAVFFNFLIANHDAHAKNYSILYSREEPFAQLAPLYDLLCTPIYGIEGSLAMRIGRESKPDRVGPSAIRRLAETATLNQRELRTRVEALAAKAPNAADEVVESFAERGLNHELAVRIAGVVNERSVGLHTRIARR